MSALSIEEDEACSRNGGLEQNAEIGGCGGRSPVPPQALQPVRQAYLQVHGSRRAEYLQHRRQSLCYSPAISICMYVSTVFDSC